jgi:polysaccharide deacetylase 2 family uncharacterized protein YibQ
VWQALAGLIVLLLLAVVGLDQWQARRGEASLFGMSWQASRQRPPAAPVEPRPLSSAPLAARAAQRGPRIAVVVDEMGGRRDVFESIRELRRPVALALLPGLPHTQSIARDAARGGIEVLLDLPMEPYRYPQIDPGSGALLMSMSGDDIRKRVARHLEALPGAVGVINHMGSKLTEDRESMRAVVEVLAARHLFLVDAFTSNLSVAYDEAREQGLPAVRRHVAIGAARGESEERASWAEVVEWAVRRGEVVVVASGRPPTATLLRELIPGWEARGLRLVPVSEVVR